MFFEWFIPKEKIFYDMFERQTEVLVEAAEEFERIVKNYSPEDMKKNEAKMKEIERKADQRAGEIIQKLLVSFMCPIDREEIQGITKNVDEIVDEIEKAMSMFEVYRIKKADENVIKFSELIRQEAHLIKENISLIRNISKNKTRILEINKKIRVTEEEGDTLFRGALRNLFKEDNTEKENTLNVFKINEIYKTLESALDRCKDVSNEVSNIVIKAS